MKRIPARAGERFNCLTIMRDLGITSMHRHSRVLCKCDCGKSFETDWSAVRIGHTKSCGCLSAQKTKERAKTHGYSGTKTYIAWKSMITRCESPSFISFDRYGGRGIKVCDRWRHSFEDFLADMGESPHGTSLDRMNNNKNYEPGNCRWATRSEQMSNRESYKFKKPRLPFIRWSVSKDRYEIAGRLWY